MLSRPRPHPAVQAGFPSCLRDLGQDRHQPIKWGPFPMPLHLTCL